MKIVGIAQESEDNIRLMVVGMPNVGKSSLINALRRNYMKQGDFVSIAYRYELNYYMWSYFRQSSKSGQATRSNKSCIYQSSSKRLHVCSSIFSPTHQKSVNWVELMHDRIKIFDPPHLQC